TGAGRFQDGIPIIDPAEGAEGEQAFVLQAHFAARRLVNMFTTDSTAGARVTGDAASGVQLLTGQLGRALECALLEIARRQRGEAIEREQVRNGSELPGLSGGGAKGTPRQLLGGRDHGCR